MYEYFELLLQERGLTASDVCKATGIGSATISTWKKRNNVLSAELLLKIAKFFGVSMEYFLGGDQIEWNPETQEIEQKEDYYLNTKTREIAQFYFDNPGHRVLFDASKNVKPEDLAKALRAIGIFTEE